jgi:hypothetical protein
MAGRPAINDPNDADAIQAKIDAYFDECTDKEKRPTFCGLALALGYASRQEIWEHSRREEAISLPIKKALLRIECAYEEALSNSTCTGAIFALKNRGWKDKNETEITGKDGGILEITVVGENKPK